MLVSSLNWTPATATLSADVAVSVTPEPCTVVPVVGTVTETVGEVLSTNVTAMVRLEVTFVKVCVVLVATGELSIVRVPTV